MATVIVPAYNESSVIRRCLDSIVDQEGVDQIVVACNGCKDDTVHIVTTEYPDVTCLDIEMPSKVNALNEAEKHVASWPVFYIDADVSLSEGAISKVIEGMQDDNLLLAAPEPVIDRSRSSWLVKKYYEAWLSLPYVNEAAVATSSFVISKEGRKRFGKFPDVIADDGFARSHFYAHEAANVAGATVYVAAPKTAASLIKIKTRARLGNMELEARKLGYDKPAPDYGSVLTSLLLSNKWFSGLIYIGFALVIRARASKQFKSLDSYEWEVDHSSR